MISIISTESDIKDCDTNGFSTLFPPPESQAMATFPFLPKDQDSSSSKITVKRSPRTLTMDDIAAEIAPQFPEHSPKEIREVLRLINNEIINTLLSGKDIEMADGSIYSLDMDGRTIIVYPPKDKP